MKPILQSTVIDVIDWTLDELFANYPEGARSKYAYFPPAECGFDFIRPTRRYMFKKSAKRYPDQFWGEVVAYHVGTMLGVTVPPAYAAFKSDDNSCGALIEWFYEDGLARFVPGGSYMQRLKPDYDRKKGRDHNFKSVQTIGRVFSQNKISVENIDAFWSKAFLFDALIGNTDRHQDNWGYLFVNAMDGDEQAQLAPLFDNGTSLGHERFTELIKSWSEKDYDDYIQKGRHHMKWTQTDANRCGHFDMLINIAASVPAVVPTLKAMIADFSIEEIADNLAKLQQLNIPIPLSADRAQFYLRLLALRKQKIEMSLNEYN